MDRTRRSTRSAPERRSAASLISVEGGGAAAEDSTNARRMPSADDSKPAKVDLKQQAFLLVYVLLGTLSVLNLCTTIACEQEAARGHAELGAARLAAAAVPEPQRLGPCRHLGGSARAGGRERDARRARRPERLEPHRREPLGDAG